MKLDHRPTIEFRVHTAMLRARRMIAFDLYAFTSAKELTEILVLHVPDIADCDEGIVEAVMLEVLDKEREAAKRSRKFHEVSKYSSRL